MNTTSSAANLRDSALISQFLSGNVNAFNILINLYWRKLYAYNYRRLQNREEAEDATQEEFIMLHRTLVSGKYNVNSNLIGWLKLKANRYCIDIFRKRKLNVVNELPLNSPQIEEEEPFTNAQYKNLENAITTLPAKDKEILNLRLWKKLSWKQVAEALGKDENTTSGKYFKILEKLKKKLVKK